MTITGVNPDPVPPGQSVTITFSPGVATNVVVTLMGKVVAVNWAANGAGSVTVGPFPKAGQYQITVTNDLNNSATTPVGAE